MAEDWSKYVGRKVELSTGVVGEVENYFGTLVFARSKGGQRLYASWLDLLHVTVAKVVDPPIPNGTTVVSPSGSGVYWKRDGLWRDLINASVSPDQKDSFYRSLEQLDGWRFIEPKEY